VLIRIGLRVPDVVIVRIVEQVIDQPIAVAVVDRAVGENEPLESGEHGMARRTVDRHAIAEPDDGRVDQAEVERDRVIAAERIDGFEA
jgi:hypothetical protein